MFNEANAQKHMGSMPNVLGWGGLPCTFLKGHFAAESFCFSNQSHICFRTVPVIVRKKFSKFFRQYRFRFFFLPPSFRWSLTGQKRGFKAKYWVFGVKEKLNFPSWISYSLEFWSCFILLQIAQFSFLPFCSFFHKQSVPTDFSGWKCVHWETLPMKWSNNLCCHTYFCHSWNVWNCFHSSGMSWVLAAVVGSRLPPSGPFARWAADEFFMRTSSTELRKTSWESCKRIWKIQCWHSWQVEDLLWGESFSRESFGWWTEAQQVGGQVFQFRLWVFSLAGLGYFRRNPKTPRTLNDWICDSCWGYDALCGRYCSWGRGCFYQSVGESKCINRGIYHWRPFWSRKYLIDEWRKRDLNAWSIWGELPQKISKDSLSWTSSPRSPNWYIKGANSSFRQRLTFSISLRVLRKLEILRCLFSIVLLINKLLILYNPILSISHHPLMIPEYF